MSKGTIIGIVVVVVVLAGVAYAVTRGHQASTQYSSNSPATSASPAASGSPAAAANSTPEAAAATITFTSGFSPAMTTVKSGQMVTFKNDSSEDIQVDSDPHPTHTDDTDLNVGPISPGQSKSVTVNKVGAFGFHNHLDPSQKGNITIQ